MTASALWAPGQSGAALRVAELLKDFDDTLELQWIPVDQRSALDAKPYRVVQNHPDHPTYSVMFLDEPELDHRVIAALFRARNITLTEIEANEKALEAMRLKEKMDQAEANADFTKWAVGKNHRVKHNGRVFE